MGGLFAPLFAWFYKLIGDDYRAEIQRQKALVRKRRKVANAAKKIAIAEREASAARREKWNKLLAKHQARSADSTRKIR